ncbi:hypothetical protein PVK06_010091 [Gossypium arboreum]|uniref:Uncharacterized protein n=1 Tax=Gossypium arboreum TaxID=29729 RepID=A0ABR0QPF2_GOSAR|nr:hypothetical protein PVK06_010091 [Gossypium arboreum]
MVVWPDSVTICITWIVHSAHYLLHVIQGGTSKAQHAVVAIIGPIPAPQNNSAGRYNSYSPNLLTESLQSSAVRDDDGNRKSHHP